MKLLLTSNGITNKSIHNALVELLNKPVAEANALFIPTGVYPFAMGSFYAGNPIWGEAKSRLTGLGWKSIGLLELSALPGIDKDIWTASVDEADVLLVWGGDPLFLAYWLKHSGLINYLSAQQRGLVYVGVSAGSIAASSIFAETYRNQPGGYIEALSSEDILFSSPQGGISRKLITGNGAGLIDVAIIPHYENSEHSDACGANAETWASKLPVPVYAIDDQTALKVVEGNIEVISEGQWKLF
jgi:dipeptidase E